MVDWFFRRITDYWDMNYDAVDKYSMVIRRCDKFDKKDCVNLIREAVREHVAALSDKDLTMAAFIMVDDLFKAANYTLISDEGTMIYLQASAGTFCKILRERGYLIHYIADTAFPETLIDYKRPLNLFADWFPWAGIKYLCPQESAAYLMKHDKVDQEEFFKQLPRYIKEAQKLINSVAKDCHDNNQHYLFLNTDNRNGEEVYKLAYEFSNSPGVITITRQESPVKHSKCSVKFPTERFYNP